MAEYVNVPVRVPISLRLPAAMMEEIDAYASKSGIRKTDAFLHFLNLGIESERTRGEADRLQAMEERIEEILALIRKVPDSMVESVLPDVRSAVTAAAADYPAIKQAYLFGSMARGTATTDSDIDLRLVIDRKAKFNLHALEHFCKAVEQQTGREVDVVTASVIKNKELAEAIERDKVLIYER